MYWNGGWGRRRERRRQINRNMRCIEISPGAAFPRPLVINRNMRCIEMPLVWRAGRKPAAINRNMRCIEIWHLQRTQAPRQRLIETWDVLKYAKLSGQKAKKSINRNMRCIEILVGQHDATAPGGLIETWDVLKCPWCPCVGLWWAD